MGRETKNERLNHRLRLANGNGNPPAQTARGYLHVPCGKYFKRFIGPGHGVYMTHRCAGITPETLRDAQRREWLELAAVVREQSRRLEAGA